ncbi:MAG: hypothetical protein RLZZ213_470 [Cyanobacteriota bacterium]
MRVSSHQLEHVASFDVPFSAAHGGLEGLLADVAGGPQIGSDVTGSGVVPVQGGAGTGEGAVHALL